MRPQTEYLESLETRLTAEHDRIMQQGKHTRDLSLLVEIEHFMLANPEPARIQITPELIQKITGLASIAGDERIPQKAGAKYDAPTWEIIYRYSTHGLEKTKEPTSPEQNRQRGYLHNHAGNAAFRLTQLKEQDKKRLLELAREHYEKSIDYLLKGNDQTTAAYTLCFKGSTEEELAEFYYGTQKIEMLEAATTSTLKGAQLTEKASPKHSSHQYAIASKMRYRTAKLCTKTPGKQRWLLRQAAKDVEKAMQLNNDPNFTMEMIYKKGKYADMMHSYTQNPEDAERAIRFYQRAIESNWNDEVSKKIAQERINKLQLG